MKQLPLWLTAALVALLGVLAAGSGVSRVVAAGYANADRFGWFYATLILLGVFAYAVRTLAGVERRAVAR